MAMSNLTNKWIPVSNYSSRNGNRICKITPHIMAGNLSIEACGNVLENRGVSANYGIGSDGRIACYVDETDRSWASASYSNDSQAITIEVANDEYGGNWHVSDTALESLINLCVDICQRYGFRLNYDGTPNGSLTRHNMFVATTCPGPYLESKFPYIAEEVNRRLDGGQPTPTPTTGVVADLQRWLNSNYGYNVDVDNIYGPDTKKHSIMALQTEFNKQLGSGLAIDGIFGPATYRACPNLYVGVSGNITKLVQYMLEVKGYSVGSYGIDGIYGNGTANAVRQFQANNGLAVDGICGSNTFSKLFN